MRVGQGYGICAEIRTCGNWKSKDERESREFVRVGREIKEGKGSLRRERGGDILGVVGAVCINYIIIYFFLLRVFFFKIDFLF